MAKKRLTRKKRQELALQKVQTAILDAVETEGVNYIEIFGILSTIQMNFLRGWITSTIEENHFDKDGNYVLSIGLDKALWEKTSDE